MLNLEGDLYFRLWELGSKMCKLDYSALFTVNTKKLRDLLGVMLYMFPPKEDSFHRH